MAFYIEPNYLRVRSVSATHWTGLDATESEGEDITIDSTTIQRGSIDSGQRLFVLQGLIVKVLQGTPTATFTQVLDILFYADTDLGQQSFALDSLLGHIEIVSGPAEWISEDASSIYRHQWADHNIGMLLEDKAGGDDPQLHVRVRAGAGDLVAADTFDIEFILQPI